MPLKLIVGPPNSGRTGAILDGFRSAAGRDPVLVVPTSDDVERFEGELTGGGEAVIGGSVGTFNHLFRLVSRAVDAPTGPPLSRAQRRRLAREAVSRTRLKLLAASAARQGFPAALEELIAELQAALIDPATLRGARRAGAPWRRAPTRSRSPRCTKPTRRSATSSASTTPIRSPPPRSPRSART